ncbi:HAD hydrolase-like protein [Brasilonema sp. CT11]|nr:HAD hydrolase-like protein [Brasilonema sp. CT11]
MDFRKCQNGITSRNVKENLRKTCNKGNRTQASSAQEFHRLKPSDADTSKPAANIVETLLSKLNIPPSSVVIVGNTPYGIESANAASVDVIAFRCAGFDDAQPQ